MTVVSQVTLVARTAQSMPAPTARDVAQISPFGRATIVGNLRPISAPNGGDVRLTNAQAVSLTVMDSQADGARDRRLGAALDV